MYMQLKKSRYSNFLKSLGPGLLWAGAAIGVSHLVQSTRAGSNYGFALVWVVLLANLFKYPFFEFGPRYAASTGESLLQGYKRLGKWVLWLFLGLSLATMFAVQAAVTTVTAGLASYTFGGTISIFSWTVIILLLCIIILAVGRFSVLDKTIKVVILSLTVTTLWALWAALGNYGFKTAPGASIPQLWDSQGIFFIIALIGWMPSAIDISVWSSLWTLERAKQTGYKPKLKESLLDFNIGYIGTAFISICFLTLGALVIFGRGEKLSPKGAVFAGQFISIYTKNIGQWSKEIISIAALTTMFSTTLTCLDAFPRVLNNTLALLFPKLSPRSETETVKEKNSLSESGQKTNMERKNYQWLYWFYMGILGGGALILLSILRGSMTFMVDIATTLSFLTAPALAVLNYKVVTSKHMPPESVPPIWLKILTWGGFVFLFGFTFLFLYYRFLNT